MSIFLKTVTYKRVSNPAWKKQPAPPLEDVKTASLWWKQRSREEKDTLKGEEGLVSLVDIAKYWTLNIKGKV